MTFFACLLFGTLFLGGCVQSPHTAKKQELRRARSASTPIDRASTAQRRAWAHDTALLQVQQIQRCLTPSSRCINHGRDA